MNKHEMSLDERISALEARLARREDRDEIENLVAVHQYYMTGNQGERAFDELYADRPDVTNEIGASGVYFGRKKARTYYEKEHVPGRLFVHTLTTPDIVISKDRSTAKGLWFTVGVESDAGDLGPNPPQTMEDRELLTSRTADGKDYMAEWLWGKLEIDFVRENGVWKIWHYHYYELFRCPYQMDWVQYSRLRQYADGLRLDMIYTSNIPYAPDEPHENHADFATTYHWQYRVDALAELVPAPMLDIASKAQSL